MASNANQTNDLHPTVKTQNLVKVDCIARSLSDIPGLISQVTSLQTTHSHYHNIRITPKPAHFTSARTAAAILSIQIKNSNWFRESLFWDNISLLPTIVSYSSGEYYDRFITLCGIRCLMMLAYHNTKSYKPVKALLENGVVECVVAVVCKFGGENDENGEELMDCCCRVLEKIGGECTEDVQSRVTASPNMVKFFEVLLSYHGQGEEKYVEKKDVEKKDAEGKNSEQKNSAKNSEQKNSAKHSEQKNSAKHSEQKNSAKHSEQKNSAKNSEQKNSAKDSEQKNSAQNSEQKNSHEILKHNSVKLLTITILKILTSKSIGAKFDDVRMMLCGAVGSIKNGIGCLENIAFGKKKDGEIQEELREAARVILLNVLECDRIGERGGVPKAFLEAAKLGLLRRVPTMLLMSGDSTAVRKIALVLLSNANEFAGNKMFSKGKFNKLMKEKMEEQVSKSTPQINRHK